MKTSRKFALWGFVFGAFGLYVLAALSLISPLFEVVFGPLFAPGRALALAFVGPVGSDVAVLILTVVNGLLYAAVFVALGQLYARLRRPSPPKA